MNAKISVIHIYLCGMLYKRLGNRVYHISEIKPIIKFHVRMPKHLQHQILREMIEFNLLKKIDREIGRAHV